MANPGSTSGDVSQSNIQAGSGGAALPVAFRALGASHCHCILSASPKKPHRDPAFGADVGMDSVKCAIRLFPSLRRLSKGPGTKLPYRFPVLELTNLWKTWRSTSSDTQIESEGWSSCRFAARQQAGDRGSMGYETMRDIRGVAVGFHA